MERCVSIDWLEVYAFEDSANYPCNADYFRAKGYFVRERDYGTRVYSEMFTIEDKKGNPWIEVRRCPPSGSSDFKGLSEFSCHLRLTNYACYQNDCISKLRDFMLLHNYYFQRIFRIDVCLDFEFFDSGDKPSKFAKRVVEKKYRKVNQAHLRAEATDNWSDFEWETLSWGNPKSMVSTKMYNKSKELRAGGYKKPWIVWKWFEKGLINDPISLTRSDDKGLNYTPEIWRIEFSIHSTARDWIRIEDSDAKSSSTTIKIPHSLSLFDAPDKLWQRFQDLAYHYFRFKHREYKKTSKPTVTMYALEKIDSGAEKEEQRKDRCADKVLFKWDENYQFSKLVQLPKAESLAQTDDILKRHLENYKNTHADLQIRKSCDIILQNIDRETLRKFVAENDPLEIDLLQRTISIKTHYPEKDVAVILKELRGLLLEKAIF